MVAQQPPSMPDYSEQPSRPEGDLTEMQQLQAQVRELQVQVQQLQLQLQIGQQPYPPPIPQVLQPAAPSEAEALFSLGRRFGEGVRLYLVNFFSLLFLVVVSQAFVTMLILGSLLQGYGVIVGIVGCAGLIALDRELKLKSCWQRLLMMLALTHTGYLISASMVQTLLALYVYLSR